MKTLLEISAAINSTDAPATICLLGEAIIEAHQEIHKLQTVILALECENERLLRKVGKALLLADIKAQAAEAQTQ
jgi:hypothetical protein